MTKRMIDAGELLDFAKKQLEISKHAIDSCDTNFKLKDTHKGCVIVLESFIEKINELATPKAKFKVGDRVHVMCRDGSILFNSVLIKEILYPPHDYTGKDSIYYTVEYHNGGTEEWSEDKIKSLHLTPAS